LLRDAAEAVPDEWLAGGSRDAYVEYLGRRVRAPRAFVAEAERARAA
ncbi:MAG: aminotransferase class I and II, partial [Thermoleophilia bacterium]|nr:aminotransferase class I and II [Thermoleophilia bacterium]